MCANHKINFEEAIKSPYFIKPHKELIAEMLDLKKDWKPSEELEEKNFETWLNQYEGK